MTGNFQFIDVFYGNDGSNTLGECSFVVQQTGTGQQQQMRHAKMAKTHMREMR